MKRTKEEIRERLTGSAKKWHQLARKLQRQQESKQNEKAI